METWIREGRPLQLARTSPLPRSRWKSALELALEADNYALLVLLLCNGYDQDQEREHPLNLALRARRFDLLDLFLRWGADPHQVDVYDLFCTYSTELFERFRAMGVDLLVDHVLARALSEHTSNKPLFGYAKRHLEDDPEIQMELDIALVHHAREGNEKGVALCLWAGADPRARVRDLRYWDDTEAEDEDLSSALDAACMYGNLKVFRQSGPDPSKGGFQDLKPQPAWQDYPKTEIGRFPRLLLNASDRDFVSLPNRHAAKDGEGCGEGENVEPMRRSLLELLQITGRIPVFTSTRCA